MKGFKIEFFIIFVFFTGFWSGKANRVQAQQTAALELDSCHAWAIQNYPLVRQYKLLDLSKEYSLKNASKGNYPQFSLIGKATYQSAVTELPGGDMAMMEMPSLSKDQYKLYGEVVQPITNLFTLKYIKEQIRTEADIEVHKVKVDEYAIRDRINQLYFGILMFDVQLNQVELLNQDINNAINLAKAALNNGVGLQSNVDMLQAELLKNEQKKIELKAGLASYRQMLALFINQSVSDSIVLKVPPEVETNQNLKRPELELFAAQRKNLLAKEKVLRVKNLPNFNLFAQGGYGRPGLNMLDNSFTFYYIGGIRLRWELFNLYTFRGEKNILKLNNQQVDVQKDVFVFNTTLNLQSDNLEIRKIRDLIRTDAEIVELRTRVAATAQSQLEFGVITANDLMSELVAKNLAEQNLYLHKIQLLMAKYAVNITTGN